MPAGGSTCKNEGQSAMKSRSFAKRASTLGTILGAALFASSCTTQPSIGPNTVTGLPGHLDGGAGQVLRFCEKLHDSGDLRTAAGMCERAHHLDPSRPEPLLELASILGDMGETELSMQAYNKVLQFAPDNGPAHYGLGRIYLDQGQHDLALAEFKSALTVDPMNARLYSAVGISNGLLGDHVEAQRVFRQGLQVAPKDAALRNNLALSLVQAGRYDEGMTILAELTREPGADLATRDNLQMAQGLAAAAEAEAALAEARAKAEAEAMAQAEMEAKAKAEAMAQVESQKAEIAPEKPAIQLSYDSRSWPMDGPGDQGSIPIDPPFAGATAEASQEPAQPITPERLAQSGTPLRAVPKPLPGPLPGPLAGPTPLAGAMSVPGDKKSSVAMTPRREMGPQTARAPETGTSDADAGTSDMRTTPAMTAKPAPTSGPASTSPQMAQPAPTGESYAVQFASYTSEERAWRGWDVLQGAATDLLSGIEPNVERTELGEGKGTVFRLRTRPSGKAGAESLCNALVAQGIECLVVRSGPQMADRSASSDPATL
jgi:Tfp pilus assembly protein PilF